MIYVLLGIIFILALFLIKALMRKNDLIEELNIEIVNVRAGKDKIKILDYNYKSLKKVYQSTLKKKKTQDMEYKKLQKLYKIEKIARKKQ